MLCEKHQTEKVWIKDKARKAGGFYRCRECNNESRRRSYQQAKADPARSEQINAGQRRRYKQQTYGLSQEAYDAMLKAQGGRCAICGTDEVGSKSKNHQGFFVDHCHDTGEVRGLLCHPCNVGLGNFHDNIGKLEAAIRYLSEARLASTARAA